MHENSCDAGASARALVWWWNPETRSEWKFCGHHNHKLQQWMLDTGHRIARDERHTLTPEGRT
jgi:hypothetical protein